MCIHLSLFLYIYIYVYMYSTMRHISGTSAAPLRLLRRFSCCVQAAACGNALQVLRMLTTWPWPADMVRVICCSLVPGGLWVPGISFLAPQD